MANYNFCPVCNREGLGYEEFADGVVKVSCHDCGFSAKGINASAAYENLKNVAAKRFESASRILRVGF